MGLAISSFLDRRNEGLADRLDWNIRRELIESHKPRAIGPVNHAQRLVSRKKLRSNSPIRKMMLNHQKGCFVFGLDNDSPCSESIHAPERTAKTPTRVKPSFDCSTALAFLSTQMDNSLNITQERSENDVRIGSAADIQASTQIRLKTDTCESKVPLYVVNGSTHSTGLGTRSLNGLAQIKRRPIMQTLKNKLFSNNPENALPTKLRKHTEPRISGNGEVDPGEYDDLYDA
jgi:hypothetical protein